MTKTPSTPDPDDDVPHPRKSPPKKNTYSHANDPIHKYVPAMLAVRTQYFDALHQLRQDQKNELGETYEILKRRKHTIAEARVKKSETKWPRLRLMVEKCKLESQERKACWAAEAVLTEKYYVLMKEVQAEYRERMEELREEYYPPAKWWTRD